ncbi:MAG: hypothetical protein VW270_07895, partial [Candidatus Poseidoniales archaeon]
MRKDLTESDISEEFGEVPGLDDAVDSFYDFEGTEPPEDQPASEPQQVSTLPFGFQGQSNLVEPGLPFGIGSYSSGMPFEVEHSIEDENQGDVQYRLEDNKPQQGTNDVIEPKPVKSQGDAASVSDKISSDTKDVPPAVESTAFTVENEPTESIEIEVEELLFQDDEEPLMIPDLNTFEVIEPEPFEPEVVRLTGARVVDDELESSSIPEYWKIDAEIPDYEEIYNDAPQVIEMEYASLEEDVVVYDHNFEGSNAVYHSPLEHSEVTQLPSHQPIVLELHPSQAMSIDLGSRNDLAHLVQQGFMAFQTGQWIEAAQSFQRLASEFPQQPAVFNNYGLALFERAKELDSNSSSQHLASSQFDSSILALREAAKLAPHQSEILLNLSSALFASGRAEKALGIVN